MRFQPSGLFGCFQAAGQLSPSRRDVCGRPSDRASAAFRALQLVQSVGLSARSAATAPAELSQLVSREPGPAVTTRDRILSAVRANHPTPSIPLPDLPPFEKAAGAVWGQFIEALARMGGRLASPAAGEDLDGFIRMLFPQAKSICSATPEIRGTTTLSANPLDLADVDVGVARAPFGVAETGSVWLSETELRTPALAYLAEHFVVLLDPDEIVGNLHAAYCDPRFKSAR
jgi:L-lactate dehydrogenase complex protein LldG